MPPDNRKRKADCITSDGSALPCQRHLFSLPEGMVYLNCGSRSPMLHQVEKVGHQAVSLKNEPWRISDDGVDGRVRSLFARLLDVDPLDIALTPSTSYAISQAAHNIQKLGRIKHNDVVIVLENQMSSNVYPWQHLCREVGAHLVAVKQPPLLLKDDSDGRSPWDKAIEACIQHEVGQGRQLSVVAVPNFLWTDGSGPIDLQRLRQLMDEVTGAISPKAVLVVDATQSLGVVPIKVKDWGIDWLACSVHKWLFGPYGLSLVYTSKEWWQDSRSEPIVLDEHNRYGADGDTILPFELHRPGYSEKFQDGAKRFDSGGRPNPILLPMVEAALKQILEWGPERIATTLAPLTKRCAKGAKDQGLVTPSSHAPHFLSVGPGESDLINEAALQKTRSEKMEQSDLAGIWADATAAYLKKNGIFVSSRAGALRIAPHVYNTPDDVDCLLQCLRSFRQERTSKADASP
eukprot:TRINITY_DN20437_c0_g1_i1.p1 TRINITY_DN20437_c0_g1~~TRINITY_DN20437_c0_g1_i1.p1  ORF type:complete len:461 (-),score=60.74 TRINITY_DN20437_c0_g1_i1:356-1738(-)